MIVFRWRAFITFQRFMSFLIIDRERYALQIGETTLGGSADELLAQSSIASLPPFAVISSGVGDETTIRALPGAMPVTLGSAPLGEAAHAIHHGDRLIVAGRTILFGDLRAAGRTAQVRGVTDDELALLGDIVPVEATAPTGGRLVAAEDGTRYDIPATGLTIGRDPECTVIIASSAVSRRHASISPGLLGYTLTDESVNGVHVNGARVQGSMLLRQGDRIRIGTRELRFEADAATYEPEASLRSSSTQHVASLPSAKAPAPPPALLATLEVLTRGKLEGTRYRIERPVAQIGRGAHNDVHVADESVSGSHATLVRRGTAWHLLDLGSRNGTYVDGARITEAPLPSGAELRVGNVKLLFRVIAEPGADDASTRGIVGVNGER